MPLGIRPIVDFAFRKVFGSPENKLALISLLNAILQLRFPIADLTIENPFNYQEFEDDKSSVLDIKAIDSRGAVYEVEMQLSVVPGLVKRMVYYACKLVTSQLNSGDDYHTIQPVYAICILDGVLWNNPEPYHQRFQWVNRGTDRVLAETMEIHTVELGK
jgi:predicted transposase/invertase (TIGR01784 family)